MFSAKNLKHDIGDIIRQLRARESSTGSPALPHPRRDPRYLVQFVEELSRINSGRAYYSSLDNLGNYIFADYAKNRRRNVR